MDVQRFASYWGLALAVLIAALLQAVLTARSPAISADGINFITMARELPDGAVQTFRRHDQHPGYPAMVLASTRVVQWLGFRKEPESWIIGAQLVTFVCGVLSIVVVWCFARDLFDTQIANIAALIFAVLPIPRINAVEAQSDTPHVLFYLLAAWLASSAVTSGRPWRLAAAGVASGIAYWIRPEGLEVFLVAMACVVVQSLLAHWPWRRLGVACAALAAATFVVAAPYPLLAGKITSKQLPFAKAEPAATFITQQAQAAQNHAEPAVVPQPALPPVAPQAVAAAAVESAPPAAASAVTTPPVAPSPPPPRYTARLVFKLLGRGLIQLAVSIGQGFKFVFLPLYMISHIALVRRKPEWMRVGFIALLGATHVCILLAVYTLSGYIAHRHVLPLVGLAMPFTALGVLYVGEKLGGVIHVRTTWSACGVLALASALVLPYSVRPFNREFVPVIAATNWVEAHAEPGSGIVCNSPYVEFYGKLPVAMLSPNALTLDAALAKAPTKARYDYVVLHVGAHDYRPEWLTQLEPYYRQVQLFPDPYSTVRHRKVLVFQAKSAHARLDGNDSRS